MHVVLLRMHFEGINAPCDGVVRVDDIDFIVHDAARMGHPLAANHPLVGCAVSERIGHAAVPSGNAHTAFDRVQQALLLRLFDGSHRPDRDDQAERTHPVPVQVGIQRVRQVYVEPAVCEEGGKDVDALPGFVTCPSAVDDQCFFHFSPPGRVMHPVPPERAPSAAESSGTANVPPTC